MSTMSCAASRKGEIKMIFIPKSIEFDPTISKKQRNDNPHGNYSEHHK